MATAHSTVPIASRPALRRFMLYGLILLSLMLISGVIFVVATDDQVVILEDAFPEPVILDLERRPDFVFPESVRSYDLSLNQFVDRFARVCSQGKYSDFRLMLSKRQPPILPARFESNFNALKQVRIQALEKVPVTREFPEPVYLMKASYELQEYAVRKGEKVKDVAVAVVKEDGEWRIGPIPREALAKLRAYRAAQGATTAPAEGPDSAEAPEDLLPELTPAAANRPLRISPPTGS